MLTSRFAADSSSELSESTRAARACVFEGVCWLAQLEESHQNQLLCLHASCEQIPHHTIGWCESHGHLHIGFYLGRSHVGSNDSNYKIIKVSVDVHRGEHP